MEKAEMKLHQRLKDSEIAHRVEKLSEVIPEIFYFIIS